jgi:hypothetical protein
MKTSSKAAAALVAALAITPAFTTASEARILERAGERFETSHELRYQGVGACTSDGSMVGVHVRFIPSLDDISRFGLEPQDLINTVQESFTSHFQEAAAKLSAEEFMGTPGVQATYESMGKTIQSIEETYGITLINGRPAYAGPAIPFCRL